MNIDHKARFMPQSRSSCRSSDCSRSAATHVSQDKERTFVKHHRRFCRISTDKWTI